MSIALRMGAGLRSSHVGRAYIIICDRGGCASRGPCPLLVNTLQEASPPFKMNNVPRDRELIMEVMFLGRRNGIKTAWRW